MERNGRVLTKWKIRFSGRLWCINIYKIYRLIWTQRGIKNEDSSH